jgi:copper ion binding protein
MKKSTAAILVFTVALLFAVSAFACDGSSTAKKTTAQAAGCGPAEQAACAATGKVCPGMQKAKVTSADATLPNGHPVQTVAEAQKCDGSTTAFLSVQKMTCDNCVGQVTQALTKIDGVCAIDVSLDKAEATVVYHADKVNTDQMTQAITSAGYTASLMSMDQVDKAQLKELCKQLCGDHCTGACKEHCANACTAKAKSKTEKTSEI